MGNTTPITPPTLPPAFLQRLQALLSAAEYRQVYTALQRPKQTAFRITLKFQPSTAAIIAQLRQLGLMPQPLAHFPATFILPPEQRRLLTESPAYHAGAIYLQNPSSMLPPLALSPHPGERILDLCAAPGSKTIQLVELMGHEGWISAVEVVKDRFFRLKANLRKHQASMVHTYHKDGSRVWRYVPHSFDRVLVDAPCSSEGQFTLADPKSFSFWSKKKITEMARKQKKLLHSALRCLKPGGELIYSTCTLAPEENEAVIDRMLHTFAGAVSIVPLQLPMDNALPGITHWRKNFFHPDLALARRILPTAIFEGFFLCKLRLNDTVTS